MSEIKSTIRDLDNQIADIDRQRLATQDMKEWDYTTPVLQRADGTQFHKLREACRTRDIVPLFTDRKQPASLTMGLDAMAHSFVVEHNWALAFKGASDFDAGEIALPYPDVAFEFQISGRRVIATVHERDDGSIMIPFHRTRAGDWIATQTYRYDSGKVRLHGDGMSPEIIRSMQPMMDLIGANVRAISITLEAEVTETTVVRAPHKLNRARERAGKLPILDYHVVSLANRSRVPRLPAGERDPDAEYTRKRLHFRRGHWRHFAESKTWIKWQLVGDPDLGFVDKHYKL